MSEVKPLNLSGGYDPMRSVDRESYADKVRKTSQMVLSQAMSQYQMKQAQQNIENQQTMRRADEYFGENMNNFTSSSANIKDPKSWSFNTGDTREKAFNDYRDKVGGNYSAFNQAWAQKQQAESQALNRSFINWRKEVGDDAKFQKVYSEWLDNLPEAARNNLMSNASQDLYGSLNSMYIPKKDRIEFLDTTLGKVTGSLGSIAGMYTAGKIGGKFLGSTAIVDKANKSLASKFKPPLKTKSTSPKAPKVGVKGDQLSLFDKTLKNPAKVTEAIKNSNINKKSKIKILKQMGKVASKKVIKSVALNPVKHPAALALKAAFAVLTAKELMELSKELMND
jgi:hypothetical protein